MKFISSFTRPAPAQVSQRPPLVLNEKKPAEKPRMRDSGSSAKTCRMMSNAPM